MVLDPFAGTGTTGLAALQLGRLFIGVDLNPAFVELAASRLRDTVGTQPGGTGTPSDGNGCGTAVDQSGST
jgi:DNA modification methylase